MKYIRLAFIGLALTILTACGGAAADTGDQPDPATADVTLAASDMAFDQATIAVAAGQTFSLAFVNEDGMPHNVAIYTDSSKTDKIFEGDLVTDDTVVYEIGALDAGEYFFDCSLHPNMSGKLVVGG